MRRYRSVVSLPYTKFCDRFFFFFNFTNGKTFVLTLKFWLQRYYCWYFNRLKTITYFDFVENTFHIKENLLPYSRAFVISLTSDVPLIVFLGPLLSRFLTHLSSTVIYIYISFWFIICLEIFLSQVFNLILAVIRLLMPALISSSFVTTVPR